MQNEDFVPLVEAGIDLLFYYCRRCYSDNVGHLLVLHSGLIQYIHHLLCSPLYQQAVECSPYPHLNSLQALVAILGMSTSYSCDCYLQKDHTPLLPGSRGMYHRRCYSMTTLATCYYYMVAWPNIYIYVTPLLSFISAGCPMFFPTRTLTAC